MRYFELVTEEENDSDTEVSNALEAAFGDHSQKVGMDFVSHINNLLVCLVCVCVLQTSFPNQLQNSEICKNKTHTYIIYSIMIQHYLITLVTLTCSPTGASASKLSGRSFNSPYTVGIDKGWAGGEAKEIPRCISVFVSPQLMDMMFFFKLERILAESCRWLQRFRYTYRMHWLKGVQLCMGYVKPNPPLMVTNFELS